MKFEDRRSERQKTDFYHKRTIYTFVQVVDKSTWTLAIILIALIMLSNLTFDKGENRIESKALDSNELIEEPVPLDQLPVEIDPDTQ